MLNGVMVGFLLGDRSVELEEAMAMLRQWLFPNDRSGAAVIRNPVTRGEQATTMQMPLRWG
jgi:hypothetical protein